MNHACRFPRATLVGVPVLLAALLAGLPRTAAAQLELTGNEGSARASAEFFGTSLPSQTDQQSFGPFGGAAVAEVTPFGHVRAAQTGSGFNAVSVAARLPGDITAFHYTADTEIDWTIENTGSRAESLVFDFALNGGELRLFDARRIFARHTARVGVSIFAISPGASGFLWSWILTLREDFDGVLKAEYDFISDPLGLGQPTLSPVTISGDEAAVSIGPFSASFDLGTLHPGGRANIQYSMSAEVSGPALRGNEGGEASLGDPFDLAGNPGASMSFRSAGTDPTVVPEPASLLLLGTGLAGLGAARRRKRRAA